jgi:hypothetical protein
MDADENNRKDGKGTLWVHPWGATKSFWLASVNVGFPRRLLQCNVEAERKGRCSE